MNLIFLLPILFMALDAGGASMIWSNITEAENHSVLSEEHSEESSEDPFEEPSLEESLRAERRRINFGRPRVLRKSSEMSDQMFRRIFRMQRSTFDILMNEVGHLFPQGRSHNGLSVKPVERLLVFLKFLGGNERYIDSQVIH
jgi:hypothetical protein